MAADGKDTLLNDTDLSFSRCATACMRNLGDEGCLAFEMCSIPSPTDASNVNGDDLELDFENPFYQDHESISFRTITACRISRTFGSTFPAQNGTKNTKIRPNSNCTAFLSPCLFFFKNQKIKPWFFDFFDFFQIFSNFFKFFSNFFSIFFFVFLEKFMWFFFNFFRCLVFCYRN